MFTCRFKRNGFLYELVQSKLGRPSENLCIYFWQVVISMACSIFKWFAVAFGAFIGLVVLVSPIMYLFGMPVEGDIAIVGGIIWGVVFSIVLGVLFAHYRSKMPKRSKDTETNLVMAKIRAVKTKVCPRIEFVSGQELHADKVAARNNNNNKED